MCIKKMGIVAHTAASAEQRSLEYKEGASDIDVIRADARFNRNDNNHACDAPCSINIFGVAKALHNLPSKRVEAMCG